MSSNDPLDEHVLVRVAPSGKKSRKARVVRLGVSPKDSSLYILNEKGEQLSAFDGTIRVSVGLLSSCSNRGRGCSEVDLGWPPR